MIEEEGSSLEDIKSQKRDDTSGAKLTQYYNFENYLADRDAKTSFWSTPQAKMSFSSSLIR